MAEEYTRDELAKWFETKALSASDTTARSKIFGATDRSSNITFVGRMYVFRYDAKTKDKLEMWDKYPLCMILEKKLNGFLGMNLHYLPKRQRMTLLNSWNKYDDEMQEGTIGKGKSNWEIFSESMNNAGLGALPKRCIKRYLSPYVRSKFIEIYPNEFDKAIQLPIDLWVFKR